MYDAHSIEAPSHRGLLNQAHPVRGTVTYMSVQDQPTVREAIMMLTRRMGVVRLLTVLAVAAFMLVGRAALAAPSQQGATMVTIENFAFNPASLTIAVGTTVT